MFHGTDVLISAWKPYIICFYVRSIRSCIIISIRGFIINFFILWWYEKVICLLIFIAQNCKNVYCKHRKTSVFQDLIAIKFHFQMNYDIHGQVTGAVAPQSSFGEQYIGGANQWYINNLEDLIICQ